jgi:FAD:protein FMN transferase
MGTAIGVDVRSGEVGTDALVDAVFDWFREVDARFSTYRPDSEVERLNRGVLPAGAMSPDLRYVREECERLREATGGWFDAWATGRFDPSAFVKGWSAQVASNRLLAAGAVNHCVNAGGDVRVRGTGRDGDGWRIGVRHPWRADRVAWVVTGTDLAVATSGTYERGGHVLDPYRGGPASGLRSVTVTGNDLGVADAYSTAALAMGTRGLSWLAGLGTAGWESAAVTETGEAYLSDRFPAQMSGGGGGASV